MAVAGSSGVATRTWWPRTCSIAKCAWLTSESGRKAIRCLFSRVAVHGSMRAIPAKPPYSPIGTAKAANPTGSAVSRYTAQPARSLKDMAVRPTMGSPPFRSSNCAIRGADGERDFPAGYSAAGTADIKARRARRPARIEAGDDAETRKQPRRMGRSTPHDASTGPPATIFSRAVRIHPHSMPRSRRTDVVESQDRCERTQLPQADIIPRSVRSARHGHHYPQTVFIKCIP